jgi:hypothetical protein
LDRGLPYLLCVTRGLFMVVFGLLFGLLVLVSFALASSIVQAAQAGQRRF